jgi:hypothetical protein
VASAVRRYVVAFQRRNLSDSAFRAITDFLYGVNGDFWFALTATSTGAPQELHAAITGTVYIFKSKHDWRSGAAGAVRPAIDDLNSFRLSLDADRDEQIEARFDSAVANLDQHADITLDFELRRAGEVYFTQPAFRDADLAFASRDFAATGGHDFDKWIADQSYFFLRDLVHEHQHHAPHVDTILTLQRRTTDEHAWRRNVLFSLHFYVISARRTRRPIMLVQALGVLAYCQSFVGICKTAGCQDHDIPQFEVAAIEASLRAQIEEQAHIRKAAESWGQRIWNARLALIAVLAPILAMIAVFVQPRIGTDEGIRRFPGLNKASDFFSDHFGRMLGLVVLVFIGRWALAALVPRLREFGPTRDVLRLGLVNRQVAAAACLFIGFTALGVGGYLGRDALREIFEPFRVLWHAGTSRHAVTPAPTGAGIEE